MTERQSWATSTERRVTEGRWRGRPVLSALIQVLALLVPVAAGVGAAVTITRLLPRPDGPAQILWWVMLLVASASVASLVDRLARRVLPLAVLLGLTMVFPDRAPSRFALARRVGSIRNLEERIRRARERGIEDDPARAAENILTLVAALSIHDRRTRGHSERVRAFTDMLAQEMKLPRHDRDRLRWAALLHDIGKLEVHPKVLNKPGKPDPHEWESLKRHPEEGARLAAPLLPWLGPWGRAIVQHHERFDGGGYPSGAAGNEISLAGRILTVTDSFETMTAARAYKKPKSIREAREELARCAGSQFDPVMVRAFLNVSIGRLWWKVGPASWLAQIPFIGIRGAVGPVATATRAAAGALAKALVGVTALGAAGAIDLPLTRAGSPTVLPPAALVSADRRVPTEALKDPRRPAPRPSPDEETREDPKRDEEEPKRDDEDGLTDKVDDAVEDPVDTVKDVVEDPVGTVEDVVDDVTDTVGDVVEDPVGTVEDTVKDTTETVDDVVDDPVGTVEDTVGDLTDGLGL